jgi:hypothetical protein
MYLRLPASLEATEARRQARVILKFADRQRRAIPNKNAIAPIANIAISVI